MSVIPPEASLAPDKHGRPKHLLIGGIALLLVVAVTIVLIVTHPWSRSPELTVEQFTFLLEHNEDVFGSVAAPDGLLATVHQQGEELRNHEWNKLYQDCHQFRKFSKATEYVTGAYKFADGDTSADLFSSSRQALSWAQGLSACDAELADIGGVSHTVGPVTIDGVWMWMMTMYDTESGAGQMRVAVFGNVNIWTFSEGSWEQWTANADVIKNAVSEAAQGA